MTDQPTEIDLVEERRGRPAGTPKSGGRKPGTPNALTKDLKQLILRRGKPVELLCDIARGVRIRIGPQGGPGEPAYTYPNLQDRAAAARVLLDRVLPAMRATELTGAEGGPIVTDTAEGIELRAAAWQRLGEALRAGGGIAAHEAPKAPGGPPSAIAASSATRISKPISDVVQAPSVRPANDLRPGYELEPTGSGVAVLYHGERIFHASNEINAVNFVSQHTPGPR